MAKSDEQINKHEIDASRRTTSTKLTYTPCCPTSVQSVIRCTRKSTANPFADRIQQMNPRRRLTKTPALAIRSLVHGTARARFDSDRETYAPGRKSRRKAPIASTGTSSLQEDQPFQRILKTRAYTEQASACPRNSWARPAIDPPNSMLQIESNGRVRPGMSRVGTELVCGRGIGALLTRLKCCWFRGRIW